MNLNSEQWYIYQKKKPVNLETYEQQLVQKQMQTMYEALQQTEKKNSQPIKIKKPRKRGTRRREHRIELQQVLKESLEESANNEVTEEIVRIGVGTERDGTERDGTERNGTERDGTERNGTEKKCTNEEIAYEVYDMEPEKTQDDLELEERIHRDVEWVLEEESIVIQQNLLFLQNIFLEELLAQYVISEPPQDTPLYKERTHTTSDGYTHWNLSATKFVPTKKRNHHMM